MKGWTGFVWLLQAFLTQGLVLPASPSAGAPIVINGTADAPWWSIFLTPEFRLASLQSKVAKKEKDLAMLLSEIAAIQDTATLPADDTASTDKAARSTAVTADELASLVSGMKAFPTKSPSLLNIPALLQAKLEAIEALMAAKPHTAVPKDITSSDATAMGVSKRMSPEDFATLVSQMKFLYADKIPGEAGDSIRKALQDRLDAVEGRLITAGAAPTAADLAGTNAVAEVPPLTQRLGDISALLQQFQTFFASRASGPVATKIQNDLQARINSLQARIDLENASKNETATSEAASNDTTGPVKRVSIAPEEFATLLGDIKTALAGHITGPLGDKIQTALQTRIDAINAELAKTTPPVEKRLAPDEFAALLGGVKSWVADNLEGPVGLKISNAIQARIDAVKAKEAAATTASPVVAPIDPTLLPVDLPGMEKRLAPDQFAALLGGVKSWVSANIDGPVGVKLQNALQDRITAIEAKVALASAAETTTASVAPVVPVPGDSIAVRSVAPEAEQEVKSDATVTAATQVVDASGNLNTIGGDKPSYVAVFPPPSFWASYFAPYLQQTATPPPVKSDDDEAEAAQEKFKGFAGKGKFKSSKSSKGSSSSKESRSISFYSLF